MLDIFRNTAVSASFFIFFSFSASAEISFNKEIRPILSDLCFHCHGFDANDRKGDLRLDDEKEAKRDLGGYAAIVAGHPEKSEIIYRITTDDQDELMPPPEKGHKVLPEQLELLKTWIKEGAKYETHWAFTPIEKPEVNSKKSAIDHFVQKKLVEKGLTPAPLASPEIQLRRVSFDLTGLPPKVEDLDLYLEEIEKYGQDIAYSNAVDRLLASPRYGERMAWQWLEASRYADTDGYQNDGPRTMWRWRDWVIKAYNENMPFDQFTIEQLAGDLLPNPNHQQLIATAFNRNNRYNSEEGIPLEEFLLENAVDRVDTTSTIWMGLTMGCARCHDHKYDPFSQKDYYQLIDYFNDVAESGRAVKFGNSEPWIKTPLDDQRQKIQQHEKTILDHQRQLKSLEKEIQKSQNNWLKSHPKTRPVLTHGLDHHFDFELDHEKVKPNKGKNVSYVSGLKGRAIHVKKDQYVNLGKINGMITDRRFSLSFWMNPKQTDKGIVLSNETNGTTRVGIFVEFVDHHLRWNINTRWISGVSTIETIKSMAKDKWTHVTLTNDGSQTAGGMKIYLDGQLQEVNIIRNTNSNKGKKDGGAAMNLGYSKHQGSWEGLLDELRFYTSRTLSPKEAELLSLPETFSQLSQTPLTQLTPTQKEVLRIAYLESNTNPKHTKLLNILNQAKDKKVEYWDSLPTTMITKDLAEGRPSYIRDRGLYDQLGEKVSPDVPSVLPALKSNQPNNRLAFAKWLVSPEHPLTARVTINRYWQLFFGQGLVKTPEDFGSQGALPSHPQLLDWLASRFIEEKWNIKTMLKTLVMSHTYRQSSQVQSIHLQKDPNNIFLARAPRLKLHGNHLRDQALYAADLLVEKRGGPSVKPYQPPGLWKEASNFKYTMGKGDDLYRRSLYTYWKRTLAPPTMAVLDTADREYCSVKPKFTNTPLQALSLLNDFTFIEAARGFAKSILNDQDSNDTQKIQQAFRKVTSRTPTQQELTTLNLAYQTYREHFEKHPKEAQELVQLNQKGYKSQHNPSVFAATMTLANVLLNLDEVTTRN